MTNSKEIGQYIKLGQKTLQLLDEGYKDIETQKNNYTTWTGARIGFRDKMVLPHWQSHRSNSSRGISGEEKK